MDEGVDDELELSEENKFLVLLYKEYEHSADVLDRTNDRVIQLLGGSLLLITILAGQGILSGKGFTLPYGIAWVIPFIIILLFGLFLLTYYIAQDHLWICRILSERINSLLSEPVIIAHEKGMPSNKFFSLSAGNIKFRIIYITLIGGCAVTFLIITYFCLKVISNTSHLAGTVFILVYGTLAALELLALSGLIYDLPNIYRKFESIMREENRILSGQEFLNRLEKKQNILKPLAQIIPRPVDVLVKFQYYWIGFFLAIFSVGMSEERLSTINSLFSNDSTWSNINDVPYWTVIMLGLILFIISELFLQQGKLLWDDIRDKERDKILPNNRVRAIASGLLDTKEAIINLFFRWTLALILGFLLGGSSLLFIFVLIILHQAVYLLWAKPQGHKHPLIPLYTVSFNLSLRFLTGVIVVVGSKWNLSIFIFMIVVLYFASFGGMSSIWKMESMYKIEKKITQFLRPQSQYFLIKGERWQHIGLLATLFLGLVIIILEVLSVTTTSTLVTEIYGYYSQSDGKMLYVEYGYLKTILTIGVLILGGMAVTWLFILIFRRILVPIKILIIKKKTYILLITGTIFVIVLVFSLFNQSTTLFLVSIFLLNMVLFINYEGMKYPEIDYQQLIQTIGVITRKIYMYFFMSNENLNLK